MPIKKRPDTDSVWPDFLDYFRKDFGREIQGWVKIFKYYGMLTPLAIIALIALFIYVDPIPPKKAYLASGQPGSSYRILSEKFAEYFAQHGFELVLVETPGLDEGFEKLNDDKSPVNASFLTAGSAKADKYPELRSLGSIQFSPIWLFYKGSEFGDTVEISELSKMRIAVGLKGSHTQNILKQLWALHGLTYRDDDERLIELSHQKAAEEFANGQLDAVFIVDGIDAPNVQKLLSTPNTKIYSFDLVEAYVKKLPFLEKVTIPRGSINIEDIFPAQDTAMLSSTVTLLVEKTTHPVHQWLLMMAAKKISNDRNQFFAKQGYFPAYLDQSMPLSPIANQYYNSGLPAVFEYFPLSIASLFNQAWVVLLTIIALIYPLFKFVSNWRVFPSKKLLGDFWQDVRDIEEDLYAATTAEQVQHHLDEFDELEKDMTTRWFDDGDLGQFYAMRMTTLRQIRARGQERLEQLKALEAKNQSSSIE
jgi:TRAP-type uncharacterized transport system substrate-binding protein